MTSGIVAEREVAGGSGERPGVVGKLDSTRREVGRCRVRIRLVRGALAVLALAATLVLADWIWVLPAAVRSVGLFALVGVAGSVLVVQSRGRVDRRDVAAEVEDRFPELGQRVRTVVEYDEPAPDTAPASPRLIEALVRETDGRASSLEFDALVPRSSLRRRLVALGAAVAVATGALAVGPELRIAGMRTLLIPAHYTTLEVKPGDATVKAGEEFTLGVTLAGRPVDSAAWSYRGRRDAGRWTTASLAPAAPEPDGDRRLIGSLGAGMKDCQADFDYRVVAGDVESPVYHVRVVHPLVLETIEANVTPPAYTRKAAETVKDGDLRAIEGSLVRVSVTLDRAPRTAELRLGAAGEAGRQPIPLRIEGPRLSAELPPISKEVQYEIAAADGDGMTLESRTYRIRYQPDEKPAIRFLRPEETLGVTPTTEVPIQVEASDDFGMTRLGIRYKLGDGPEETLHLAELKDQPVTAGALATLYLEKHAVRYPDAITYHAFAEDSYPGGPHRTVSELRYIDILPYKQEYEFREGGTGGGGSSGGTSASLEELIARQRVNLNRTFLAEGEPTFGDDAARRLARFEGELADATDEFAAGLAERGGSVPSLEEAARSMRSAAGSLGEKDVKGARPKEESALRSLIAARQNLRKLLSQGQSSSASECRSFDAKQFQRIRRPPADPTKKSLARLENDLNELARREQKFSEEIEAKGRGGPGIDPPPSGATPPKQGSKSSSSGPGKPGNSGSSSGEMAQQSPAEQQRQAAEEAERLRQLASRDESLSEMTNRRLADAAEAVKDSSRSVEKSREAQAAAEAREAARKLESVARQVGAQRGGEPADRLARQRDMAQALALAERELGKALGRESGSKVGGSDGGRRLADRQRDLADEAAALADVLDRSKQAVAESQPELAQDIGRAARANPPLEVEDAMRQNAAAIGEGRTAAAAQAAEGVAGRLEALAQDLESIRRAAIQPQLDRLLAAEKQAAELQERLRSVRQSSQQAEAEKAVADLASRLDAFDGGDGPLRQATDQLSGASRSGAGWTLDPRFKPGQQGYFVPPVSYTEAVGAVALALQAKIQELMLDRALSERNGPVPPQYRELVDDYYRVLSQDLR